MSKNKLVVSEKVARPQASKFAAAIGHAYSGNGGRSEGHPVDLAPSGPGKNGTMRYTIDVGQAPVPQRRYSADIAHVSFTGHDIKFVFAQTCLFGEGFESALVVRVNPQAFADLVVNLNHANNNDLVHLVDKLKLQDEALTMVTSKPAHTANVVANVFGFAFAGHETCIDFYHANAFAFRKSENSKKLELESIVRVDLRTSLFKALTVEAEKIMAILPDAEHLGE